MSEDRDITLEILKKLFAATGKDYSEKLIDYGTNPANARPLEKYDGYGKCMADDCGDVVEVWLRVRDGKVEEATFQTTGCLPTCASVAAATAMAKGRPSANASKSTRAPLSRHWAGCPRGIIIARCLRPGPSRGP